MSGKIIRITGEDGDFLLIADPKTNYQGRIHKSLIADNHYEPVDNWLEIDEIQYRHWFLDDRRKAFEEDCQLFYANIPLFVEKREVIWRNPRFYCIEPPYGFGGGMFVECSSITLGDMLALWETEPVFSRKCKCGGRTVIYSFAGSILSGGSSASGVCLQCHKVGSYGGSGFSAFFHALRKHRMKYIGTDPAPIKELIATLTDAPLPGKSPADGPIPPTEVSIRIGGKTFSKFGFTDDGSLRFASRHDASDERRSAVESDPLALQHISHPSAEICELAVRRNPEALRYVPVDLQSPALCELAVRADPKMLQFVKRQTPEICLLAVQRRGRCLAMVREQTPEIVRAALANSPVAAKYIEDESAPPKLSVQQRKRLIRNKETTVETLVEMAKDRNEWVRACVVENENTPIETLAALAKDKKRTVRSSVAKKLNTPVDVLVTLAKDREYLVRYAVAENVNTPVDVLNILAKDADYSVRDCAERTLEVKQA
jgi:hypothetical protein